MYTVKHNNVFFALLATSYGHYIHHQANTVHELKYLNRLDTYIYIFFYLVRQPPQWALTSSFMRFLDHTQRHTTIGRTPLDE